jgi:hypothetical protein
VSQATLVREPAFVVATDVLVGAGHGARLEAAGSQVTNQLFAFSAGGDAAHLFDGRKDDTSAVMRVTPSASALR